MSLAQCTLPNLTCSSAYILSISYRKACMAFDRQRLIFLAALPRIEGMSGSSPLCLGIWTIMSWWWEETWNPLRSRNTWPSTVSADMKTQETKSVCLIIPNVLDGWQKLVVVSWYQCYNGDLAQCDKVWGLIVDLTCIAKSQQDNQVTKCCAMIGVQSLWLLGVYMTHQMVQI